MTVIWPCEDLTAQIAEAPAVTQTQVTESYWLLDAIEPPDPDRVDALPKLICWPAFCAIFQPPAPFPWIQKQSPKTDVAGRVKVTKAALSATYPFPAAIVADVPVVSFQTNPPPAAVLEAMAIDPEADVIVIPVP